MTGEGYPTEEEEKEAWSKVTSPLEDMNKRLRAAVAEGLGAELRFTAKEAVSRLTLDHSISIGKGSRSPNSKYWKDAAIAIAAPIVALGHDPSELPASKYEHYVVTVSEALRFLLVETFAPDVAGTESGQ